MPEPTPHRCPTPTTEEPAPSACCLMLVWISSRIVIAAMPPVASNLQTTINYGSAVNACGYDPLMAEQEKRPSPPSAAPAKGGDPWGALVVEALLRRPQPGHDPPRPVRGIAQ